MNAAALTYDEKQLAAVFTVCAVCRRAYHMTQPQAVCIACRRVSAGHLTSD